MVHMLQQTLENLQDQMALIEVASTREHVYFKCKAVLHNDLPWRHVSFKWHKGR